MATSDATFLAEVEDFLTSCDLPLLQTLHDDEDEDNKNFHATVDAPTNTAKSSQLQDTAAAPPPSKSKKKTEPKLDAVAKREREKAKDRKRRSAYRERRRVERETLTLQVEELSSKLTELQDDPGRASVWKAIGTRQLQARVSAETEQRYLVAAVDARALMIQEFTRFVKGHLSSEMKLAEGDLGDTGSKTKRMRLEPSDEDFFDVFLQELDAFRDQADDVMQACGLGSTEEDWDGSKPQWREGGRSGDFVFRDKYVIPLGLQQTCGTLWKMAHMPHRQEGRRAFDKVEDPENTAAYKFRVTTQLKSGRAVSILQRAATRRYKRNDREVTVWRSFTEGEGLFTGMHTDETGWVVATPLMETSTERTLVRTCIHHTPMHFSHAAIREADVKQFTGVILDAVSKDGVEITSGLKQLGLDG